MERSSGPRPSSGDSVAAQHVIARAHDPRALQGPQIAHLLHHANQRCVARCVRADRAGLQRVDVAAFLADRDLAGGLAERAGQRQEKLLALLDEMQRSAARGPRPKPRQLREQRDQLFDFGAGGLLLRGVHSALGNEWVLDPQPSDLLAVV